jgi:hypothetical protein
MAWYVRTYYTYRISFQSCTIIRQSWTNRVERTKIRLVSLDQVIFGFYALTQFIMLSIDLSLSSYRRRKDTLSCIIKWLTCNYYFTTGYKHLILTEGQKK